MVEVSVGQYTEENVRSAVAKLTEVRRRRSCHGSVFVGGGGGFFFRGGITYDAMQKDNRGNVDLGLKFGPCAYKICYDSDSSFFGG